MESPCRAVAGIFGQREGLIEAVGDRVQVIRLQAAFYAAGVDVGADDDAIIHRDSQGWAPPIPPAPQVTVNVPARDPSNRLAATAAKVS